MTLLEQLDNSISVSTGDDITDKHAVDWTFVNHCKPAAVLKPANTAEVSAILSHCHQHKQPVVVQGGLTGLAGGATPVEGEVALSLERMNGIEEIDIQAMTMTVEAGTPLEVIQKAALDNGLIFPMDLGARGTANIGGNVSTNAGGVQVIRYGMTRALIMGLEAVLPDGTVITSLNKMLKNNAGYDLKHLFIGSEGTLGVVTKVVLRLFPKPKSRCTALVAFDQFSDSIDLLGAVQADLSGLLTSFEVMWDLYYDNVATTVDTFTNPFENKHHAYAIVEITGNHQQRDMQLFEEFLAAQCERGIIADVVIAQSVTQADNIWTLRHGIGDFGSAQPVINYDVSIPISRMDDFANELMQNLQRSYPHITTLLFGHIGDSNLHVVIGDYNDGEFSALKDLVHVLTGQYDGSVSAEHGIGKLKADYLALSRSDEEIALMKLLKRAIDPNNILNPGRVIAI
ncbi:MAG: FAD-binding oxidoreductase [Pseudomonadota bacterium]